MSSARLKLPANCPATAIGRTIPLGHSYGWPFPWQGRYMCEQHAQREAARHVMHGSQQLPCCLPAQRSAVCRATALKAGTLAHTASGSARGARTSRAQARGPGAHLETLAILIFSQVSVTACACQRADTEAREASLARPRQHRCLRSNAACKGLPSEGATPCCADSGWRACILQAHTVPSLLTALRASQALRQPRGHTRTPR